MIRLAVLPRVLTVLAVAVLAACTSRVGGTPVAGTTLPEKPKELTAELVFDDLTTVDPCSLVDLSVLESLGTAKFGPPESLDYCAVDVEPQGGGKAILTIGSLEAFDPALAGVRVDEFDGELYVTQVDDDPSFCSQQLVFPDDVVMKVQGSLLDGSPNTCPMVEAAMKHAVEVIQDGAIEHRKPDDDSLVKLDPCDLLSDADVGDIPGLSAVVQPNDPPANHECFWETGSSASRISVRLTFGAGPKPTAHETGANETPIAGRPTATNPYPSIGDGSYCAVETGHIDFDEVRGEDAVELASIYVRMPAGQVAAGCTAATAVANLVWPKLPSV